MDQNLYSPLFFHFKQKGYNDLTALNLHVTIVLLAE